MANDKNVATGSKDGVVTHKLLITTTEGTFSISLFSNNKIHQNFATAFNEGEKDSELIVSLITGAKIVAADEKPADDGSLARLQAMKEAAKAKLAAAAP
jgi:hypothetical protein